VRVDVDRSVRSVDEGPRAEPPAGSGGEAHDMSAGSSKASTAREAPLQELSREERLLLMRFVCSFAWAELEIKQEERELVASLIQRLQLDDDEKRQVLQWLDSPPPPESVDPNLVPREHRMKFLRAVESTVAVDGEISPEERENLVLFAHLIR
jgi:hypothetical protein